MIPYFISSSLYWLRQYPAMDQSWCGDRWTQAKPLAQHNGLTIYNRCILERIAALPNTLYWVCMTDQLGPSVQRSELIKLRTHNVQSFSREKENQSPFLIFSLLTFTDHITAVGVWEKSQIVCATVPRGGRHTEKERALHSLKTCTWQWQAWSD